MVNNFKLNLTPKLIFGAGSIKELPKYAGSNNKHILLITGRKSYMSSSAIPDIISSLTLAGHYITIEHSGSEPSPVDVDRIVESNRNCELVIAIGGGSVIDTGKAVSAMIPAEGSTIDFLEGVGKKTHPGNKVLFFAVPTTAGTGSEATSNAVLSITGINGFKKSLRHENLVPDLAIVDPALTINCPSEITANSGMDAFTQLLESYLSVNSNVFTDSLALEGMHHISRNLVKAIENGSDLKCRSALSYAAYLSGITLANAGLGLTHGFASAIGGQFNIPHGVVCGTLMGAVNRYNIEHLLINSEDSPAKQKYTRVGEMLSQKPGMSGTWYMEYVSSYIDNLIESLKIKRLGYYGVTKNDLERIVMATDHKANPVKFDNQTLMAIAGSRI